MFNSKTARLPFFLSIRLFCVLILVTVFFAGCSGASSQLQQKQKSTQPITWPPPPQQARITFEREIVFPRDISKDTGFLSLVKELFLGKNLPVIVRPYGLALDKKDNLLIVDTGGRRIHIFHLPEGKYRQIPSKKDNLVLFSPIDVDVADNGKIYVSDSEAKKVYVFNQDGLLETTVGKFMRPTGLAVNSLLARIYVVDTMAHQIRVYDSTSGKLLFDLGKRGEGPGEFNYPTNICLDSKGNLYVTDSMNFRVQIFDQDGDFISSFGTAGDGPGTFSKPRGIGVDSDGHIYVADAEFDNVQIFNSEGHILLYFGTSGSKPGEFYLPAGLLVDSNDRIYVADSFNQRIQVFQYLKEKTEKQDEQQPKKDGGVQTP